MVEALGSATSSAAAGLALRQGTTVATLGVSGVRWVGRVAATSLLAGGALTAGTDCEASTGTAGKILVARQDKGGVRL